MNGGKVLKEAKVTMAISLAAGVVLLGAGLLLQWTDIDLVPDNKALMALSLLPFAMALVSFLKVNGIRKSPQQMRKMLIKENDERLVALNNEADAKSFKWLQGMLYIAYFGYTFMYPGDVFKTAGWWILLVLFLAALFLQTWFRCVPGKKQVGE